VHYEILAVLIDLYSGSLLDPTQVLNRTKGKCPNK